jgi:O-methyltransferase involved in polyketide biosynthesis
LTDRPHHASSAEPPDPSGSSGSSHPPGSFDPVDPFDPFDPSDVFGPLGPDGKPKELPAIDTRVAHTSRVYDYLLGGTNNFAVDRDVARDAFAAYPGGVHGARADARANRAFLGRAVRYLAAEAGIRQFVDVGPGIPSADNTHAVAQQVAPSARVVYVDNDPMVLAHAHKLLESNAPRGTTAYVHCDLREPDVILRRAAATLDLSEPVGLVLVGLLHVVPDEDDPHGLVARLMRALAPGSYLAVSHLASDTRPRQMAEVGQRLQQAMARTNPPALRSVQEITRFFDGLDLVEPGIVRAVEWRPDGETPRGQHPARTPLYGGVARKPAP